MTSTWTQTLHPTYLRKRAGSLFVDGFFNGIARAGKLHPKSKPARHGVAVTHNVAYKGGGDSAHMLDIWRPVDAAPGQRLPTILYVHGGGFRILSKDTHWVMALHFARRGWQVVSINYRLAPKHPFPAAIEDTCDAFVWLTANAVELGVDLGHLVLAGESAGANLVTSLAVATTFERPEPFAQRVFATGVVPRAVLPACGILQVTDVDRVSRRKPQMRQFTADRIHEVADGYLGKHPTGDLTLADPLLLLESTTPSARTLPPFFAGVGTWDPLLDDSRRLGRALKARGVVEEIRYYPKELHAFHAFVVLPQARDFWSHQFAFLARLGLDPRQS